ncbi:MAG: hypothetical protein J0G30_01775 [Actinomycetales bacterium]|nr:hypothetical protein [Actinomycetales bacterium]
MLAALHDDALRRRDDGSLELRLALPWIRALPLSALRGLEVTMGPDADLAVVAELAGRTLPLDRLAEAELWWHLPDRLVLVQPPGAGANAAPAVGDTVRVTVRFVLAVAYLAAGPDGPLTLPFVESRELVVAPASAPGPAAEGRVGAAGEAAA